MKRIISILLIALFALLTLAGCGEATAPAEMPASNIESGSQSSPAGSSETESRPEYSEADSKPESGETAADPLEHTVWIALSFQPEGAAQAETVYEGEYGMILSFSGGSVSLEDTDGYKDTFGYSVSEGKIAFEGYSESELSAEFEADAMELTAPTGTLFRLSKADESTELEYRAWMAALLEEEEPESEAPSVAPGYRYYENELFSSEIPEDWELSRVKVQYFGDTITEPHEGKSCWCTIIVSGAGFKDGAVEELVAGYNFEYRLYEDTVAGQSAQIVERGGGALGIAQRDIYTQTPGGTRYILHFTSPSGDGEFDFSEIGEIMDHFLSSIRFFE